MQTVPVAQVHSSSQQYPQQAVFAPEEASGRLYAAGGAAPSTVHSWDMSQERCTQQVCSSNPAFFSYFCWAFPHSSLLRHVTVTMHSASLQFKKFDVCAGQLWCLLCAHPSFVGEEDNAL